MPDSRGVDAARGLDDILSQSEIVVVALYIAEKNGHETDLEMSPRLLGTTVFEEIYIRTMGN